MLGFIWPMEIFVEKVFILLWNIQKLGFKPAAGEHFWGSKWIYKNTPLVCPGFLTRGGGILNNNTTDVRIYLVDGNFCRKSFYIVLKRSKMRFSARRRRIFLGWCRGIETRSVKYQLLGTLSYLGHLVIFKTAKNSITWDTHVKGGPFANCWFLWIRWTCKGGNKLLISVNQVKL